MISVLSIKNYNRRKVVDLIKNAGWIFFDKIFRMATGLLVGVWIARYLGPSQFGLLNYASIFPLVLTAFAGLGLTNILFNEFIIERNDLVIKNLVISSIFIKLISGTLSFLIISLISINIHSYTITNTLVIISATSLIVQSLDVVDVYFQSKRAVHYSIIPKLIVFLVATVFRVLGLFSKADILYFVIIASSELLLSSFLSFIIYINYSKLKFRYININIGLVKYLLRMSWPIMISELFLFLYVRIDLLMIKQLSTSAELGNYSVTLRITDLWYFIPIAITTSVIPNIISIRESDYQEYIKRYGHLLNVLATISISIGILITLFANFIINVMYGDQYEGVGRILSVNIWTGLFVFIAIGTDRWFIIENKQKFVLYRTIVGAIINIGLNFLLIPFWGALGASLATLVAQIFASYLMNGLYTRTREIFQLQTNALFFFPRMLIKLTRHAFANV